MTEIQTLGLKGVLNTTRLLASIQKEEVIDVQAYINEKLLGYRLPLNMTMLRLKTEKAMYTGRNLSNTEFLTHMSYFGGKISSKAEYDNLKLRFTPEFNTGTNKIGEGFKATANKIMLTTRAEFHIKNGHDLFPYEYLMMLMENMAMKGL